MNSFFHTDLSLSDSLKNVLIYETVIGEGLKHNYDICRENNLLIHIDEIKRKRK